MKWFKQTLLSFFCIWFLLLSGSSQLKLPNTILKTLKPSHPRLLVSSINEFEDLIQGTASDEFIQLSVKNIIANADSILNQQIVTYEFIDRLRMDTRKFYYRSYCLSMAYRLTNEKKYATNLWLNLESASKFPDWNPDHFLDAATMTQAFAISYDWLFDVWTADQRDYLKQQIITKGLLQGMRYYDKLVNKGVFNWADIDHNWSLVCNGGMAIGALAIADEEPVLAEKILKEALARYPAAVNKFGPDGAFSEGPGYWGYAMRFTVTLLSSLETALGTDFGISNTPGFSAASLFFVSMGGAKHTSFNYADANPVITRAIELFWLAKKFNQPEITALQRQYSMEQFSKGVWLQSPLELLWYKTAKIKGRNLSLDNYYRGAEIASLRSSWSDTAWFVAFKAGENGVNHGHLDIGTYVLDYNDERWLMDLGFENYNVPGYFGDANTITGGKRWTYYRTRAEGHNTLVINPESNEDQNIAAKTKFEKFITSPDKSFGIMDITDAYKGKVKTAKRGIALIKRNTVLVQDEITADNALNLYWFAHTKANIILSPDKKEAILKLGDKSLYAQIKNPSYAFFEIVDAQPLATSPQPLQNNKNDGIRKLSIHIEGKKTVTVAVAFTDSGTKNDIMMKQLSNW